MSVSFLAVSCLLSAFGLCSASFVRSAFVLSWVEIYAATDIATAWARNHRHLSGSGRFELIQGSAGPQNAHDSTVLVARSAFPLAVLLLALCNVM